MREAFRKIVYYKSSAVIKCNLSARLCFYRTQCKTMTIQSSRVTNNIGFNACVIIAASSLFHVLHKLQIIARAKTARGEATTAVIIRQEQQTTAKGRFHRRNANAETTAAARKLFELSFIRTCTDRETLDSQSFIPNAKRILNPGLGNLIQFSKLQVCDLHSQEFNDSLS